jgi:hypothetical protein
MIQRLQQGYQSDGMIENRRRDMMIAEKQYLQP